MEVWSDEGYKRERRAAPELLFKLLGSLSLFRVSKENTHAHTCTPADSPWKGSPGWSGGGYAALAR